MSNDDIFADYVLPKELPKRKLSDEAEVIVEREPKFKFAISATGWTY